MTTKTKITSKPSTAVDFDARLEMAKIGMDVLLERHLEDLAPVTCEPLPQPLEPEREPNQVLALARGLIEYKGWARNSFTEADGSICAMEALRRAAGGDHAALARAETVLLERIHAEFGQDGYSVPGWNDSRRRVDEVLRLLY